MECFFFIFIEKKKDEEGKLNELLTFLVLKGQPHWMFDYSQKRLGCTCCAYRDIRKLTRCLGLKNQNQYCDGDLSVCIYLRT